MTRDPVATTIPGRDPIELVAYYEEFRDYYPYCELETKRWFVEHVRADWWIFDIGANVGYYTILFSQLAPAGRVFAFEPTATAEMLRTNLRHNDVGNAEVHEVALAATTGEREDRIFRLWGTDDEVKTCALLHARRFHRPAWHRTRRLPEDRRRQLRLRGPARRRAHAGRAQSCRCRRAQSCLGPAQPGRRRGAGTGWPAAAIARPSSWTTTISCCSESPTAPPTAERMAAARPA